MPQTSSIASCCGHAGLMIKLLTPAHRGCRLLPRWASIRSYRTMASNSSGSISGKEERSRVVEKPDRSPERTFKRPQCDIPDHFLAVQLPTDAAVLSCVKDVQAALVAHDAALKGTLVDVAAAHLTLFVCRLDTPERVQAAKGALAAAGKELQSQVQGGPLSIQFKGLGHFRHQVLYMDVVQDEGLARLKDMANVVARKFREARLHNVEEDREFVAHLTIAKLSAMRKRGKGRQALKKIPAAAYETLEQQDGGTCSFGQVQLCSMQGRSAGSYNPVKATIQLPGSAAASHQG